MCKKKKKNGRQNLNTSFILLVHNNDYYNKSHQSVINRKKNIDFIVK